MINFILALIYVIGFVATLHIYAVGIVRDWWKLPYGTLDYFQAAFPWAFFWPVVLVFSILIIPVIPFFYAIGWIGDYYERYIASLRK